jgi:plastocyanin
MNNHILIIPEGLKVQWVNADPLVTINGDQGLMPHGIKISDTTNKVLSASSILNRDQNSFSYTFTKEGSYSYSCFIHPFMTGKIQVINLPGVNLAAKP